MAQRKTALFVTIALLSLTAIGCSRPEAVLTADVSEGVPTEIVDLNAVADIDWYLPTTQDQAGLENGTIVPFDRKADAGHIRSVEAQLGGEKQLAFSGLVDYQWSGGQNHSAMGPLSVTLDMMFAGNGESSGFAVEVAVPEDAVQLIVHGSCSGVEASMTARLGERVVSQPLPCQGEDEYAHHDWTYRLEVSHAAGETLTLNLDSVDGETGVPTLTLGSILLGGSDTPAS